MIDSRDSVSLNDTTKILNLQKNDWNGSDTAMKKFQGQYNQAVKDFIDEGYPKEYLEDYANVYILSKYNVGVKMFRKEEGEFKELNFYETIDSFGKKHKKISICQ